MRNKSLGRAADFRLDETQDYSCRNTAGCDEAPRPTEVLYDIGVAIATLLGRCRPRAIACRGNPGWLIVRPLHAGSGSVIKSMALCNFRGRA